MVCHYVTIMPSYKEITTTVSCCVSKQDGDIMIMKMQMHSGSEVSEETCSCYI